MWSVTKCSPERIQFQPSLCWQANGRATHYGSLSLCGCMCFLFLCKRHISVFFIDRGIDLLASLVVVTSASFWPSSPEAPCNLIKCGLCHSCNLAVFYYKLWSRAETNHRSYSLNVITTCLMVTNTDWTMKGQYQPALPNSLWHAQTIWGTVTQADLAPELLEFPFHTCGPQQEIVCVGRVLTHWQDPVSAMKS